MTGLRRRGSQLRSPVNTKSAKRVAKVKGQPRSVLIVCYNRCLYCGRRTTHEVCHAHGAGHWRKHWPFKRVGVALIGLEVVRGRTPMQLPERTDESEEQWQRRWQRAQTRLWRAHARREPEVCTDITCPQAQVDWR